MRRAALTAVSTMTGVCLLLLLKPHQAPVLAVPRPADGHLSGRLRDGTFTGDRAGTPYGPVRVAAIIHGGRLVSVRVLLVPVSTGRDRDIASYAIPRLTREALGTQSARIDAVSGASYTSAGYTASLQSALDRADG